MYKQRGEKSCGNKSRITEEKDSHANIISESKIYLSYQRKEYKNSLILSIYFQREHYLRSHQFSAFINFVFFLFLSIKRKKTKKKKLSFQ